MEGCSPCGETTQAPPRGEGADGTGATVSKLEICGRCRAGTEGEGGGAAGTAKACGAQISTCQLSWTAFAIGKLVQG